MDIAEVAPGDTFSRNGLDFVVAEVDHSNSKIGFDIGGQRNFYSLYALEANGYVHTKPIPAAPAPTVIVYHTGYQPIISTNQIWIAEDKPVKTRKQVSHNGKDWCDYRLLLDADPFESYEHRREI